MQVLGDGEDVKGFERILSNDNEVDVGLGSGLVSGIGAEQQRIRSIVAAENRDDHVTNLVIGVYLMVHVSLSFPDAHRFLYYRYFG